MNLELEILLKVMLGVFLGGFIGVERELACKSAGLRTHMLIAGVSTFLVGIGYIFALEYDAAGFERFFRADPFRIISAIITGLGFIGGGTIIRSSNEDKVEGLTTAASLLFVSAIGMAVGLDQFILAIGITLFILIINFFMKYFERWLVKKVHKNRSN